MVEPTGFFLAMIVNKGLSFNTGSGCVELEIPHGHAISKIPVWYHFPKSEKAEMPVVIVLHGTSRNAQASRDNWRQAADLYGFGVAVPDFEHEFFSDARYAYGRFWISENSFKPIDWENTHGRILDILFNRIREGLNLEQKLFTLYGHSAGAAFAHRYLMLAPHESVELAIFANAGWYTLPDDNQSAPFGTNGAGLSKERTRILLGKPVSILLGENDTLGPYADWWPQEYLEQGQHRVARGLHFFNTAKELAERLNLPFGWECEKIPNVGHENKKMIPPAVQIIATHHGLKEQDFNSHQIDSKTDPE
jgi:pimeloyl-ACP methyl ester carboxylesterase